MHPLLAGLTQEGLCVLRRRKSTPGDNHGHHGVCIHDISNKVEVIRILADGFDRSPGSYSLAQLSLLSNACWSDADDVLSSSPRSASGDAAHPEHQKNGEDEEKQQRPEADQRKGELIRDTRIANRSTTCM